MRHAEQPDYYVEPTDSARHGSSDYYDSYDPYEPHDPYERTSEPSEPTPWYRRAPALVASGAIGAVVLALAAYGVVSLAGGHSNAPTSTTTPAPSTTATTAVTTTTAAAPSYRHGPGGDPTETVTESTPAETPAWSTDTGTSTVPSSTDTGASTVPPGSVTVSPTTQPSTVTQTVTVTPPRRNWLPHF